MKICILVPSDEYLQQAGVRIRYRRIEDTLSKLGHSLYFLDIQTAYNPQNLDYDVFLISKCYDARALLFIDMISSTGKIVGIDLFDDYFSQDRDSRLVRLRRWFRAVGKRADFFLCSTPSMRETAERAGATGPFHVMNDPAPGVDAGALRAVLHEKLDRARQTRQVDVAWFGMGDNPYFPVGLADLAAFGGELSRLRGRGFDVRLSVLTNVRALTADGLALLRRIALPHSVEEWTVERENTLLKKSFACFLPVNAQGFSIVKSLNRGLSALTSGNQVLSCGYPLYGPLGRFIYRDARSLLADLECGDPLLNSGNVEAFEELVGDWGESVVESSHLIRFLQSVEKRRPEGVARGSLPFAAIVHGKQTSGEVHKFAQRAKALSVASPYCDAKLNFDIRFQLSADEMGLECLVSERALQLIEVSSIAATGPPLVIGGTTYARVGLTSDVGAAVLAGADLARGGDPGGLVASYAVVTAAIETALAYLFPQIACHYSESARLPLLPASEITD